MKLEDACSLKESQSVSRSIVWDSLQPHCSLPGSSVHGMERKAMTKFDNILRSRDYFADKGLYSKSYGFPVVMYGWQSWTIKKVEHWRIDAFKLWCWRRLLRVPWTGRSNQSILKEINPEWKDWCWTCISNTLATWYEELTHWKRSWCWERLKAGGEGGGREWGD